MPEPETSAFERSVRVEPIGPGRYAADVDASWNGPVAPNGGVLAATMLRAAQAELGPAAPPPRTIAAQYLEAPKAGPVELAVEVLRAGKRVAMCDVRMHQDARVVVQATVVLSASREDLTRLRRTAPQAPPPDPARILPPDALAGAPRVFSMLELQPTLGGVPFSGAGEASCGGWTAIRGDEGPVDAARLCAVSDLWFPAIFPVLERFAGVPTLQLTVQLRRVELEAEWPVLGRFRTRHVAEGHLEEQGEIWSSDGVLLAESTQLALLLPLGD